MCSAFKRRVYVELSIAVNAWLLCSVVAVTWVGFFFKLINVTFVHSELIKFPKAFLVSFQS